MKYIQKFAGFAASAAIVLILLSTAFDLAVYHDYRFFEKEYIKYDIQQDLPMEMEDIMQVTTHMMDYLRGDEDDMQIVTHVAGESREFFNDQDLFHMAEVRNLFIGMYRLRTVGLILLGVSVLCMLATGTAFASFFKTFQLTLAAFAVVIVGLGAAIAINFDRLFIVFHHIVFDNDQWLFDPRTDLMINMLPEGLFMDFAIRILIDFTLMFIGVEAAFIACRKWLAGGKNTSGKASGKRKGIKAAAILLGCCIGVSAFPGKSLAAEQMEPAYATHSKQQTEQQIERRTELQTAVTAAIQPVSRNNFLNLSDWPAGPGVESDAAILIDARTGNILYARNIDEQFFPASITKVLTALIACEEGNLDDIITYSHHAIFSIPWDGSTVGFSEGEQVTLLDSIYGMMLASGNEAAVGIAEYISGSEEAFADKMNERAREAGAMDSHFVTSNGLHDDDHYTTAYDMAMILKAAVQNETFLQIASTYSYQLAPTNKAPDGYKVTAGHRMLNPKSEYYNPMVVAGKTGYTSKAGNTLVSYARQEDMELICVILHSHQTQYPDTTALLNYGFNNYICYNAAKEDTTFAADNIGFFSFLSNDFKKDPISVRMEDTYLLVPATVSFSDITSELEYNEDKSLTGVLGYVHYSYEGIELGTGTLYLEYNRDTDGFVFSETVDASETQTDEKETVSETMPEKDNQDSEQKKILVINIWHILGWILLIGIGFCLLLFLVYYFSPRQRRKRRRRKLRNKKKKRSSSY